MLKGKKMKSKEARQNFVMKEENIQGDKQLTMLA